MKKVLIISTVGLKYDGITSVITSYLNKMNKDGLDICVLSTIEIEDSIKKNIESIGCKVIELSNRKTNTVKYFFQLTKYIYDNHFDIIHAHGNSSTLFIEMFAGWLGGCKKRIAHCHNTQSNHAKINKLLKPLFNLFYTDALACSKEAGKWMFGNRQFDILMNGRDVEKYKFNFEQRKIIRTSLGVDNEIAIGHVGGFYPQKNHLFLVEIYKELLKIEPSIKLYMIGDGPLKSDIEEKCKSLAVKFINTTNNIENYLSAMDGMLLPSLFEGMPLVAIEWQINGLPCLLSDRITKDCKLIESTEFMPLDTSARDWAVKILELVKTNSREENSNKGYVIATNSDFNINNCVKKLENIYKG